MVARFDLAGEVAMSKDLLLVAEAVANEKGVAREVIFDALEAALASAAKKRFDEDDVSIRVTINRSNGNYETFRVYEVVADDVVMESPHRQLRLMVSRLSRKSKTRTLGAFPRRPQSRSSCNGCVKPSVVWWCRRTRIASGS
jgi:hypothetical protein